MKSSRHLSALGAVCFAAFAASAPSAKTESHRPFASTSLLQESHASLPPLRRPPVEQRGPGRPPLNPNFREPEPLTRLPDGSQLTAVDGRRQGLVFRNGATYRITGRGLSGDTAAWILGNPTGGSVLDIVRESDTELLVRVSSVAGANSRWPRIGPSDRRPGVWLLVESDYGQRRFNVLLRDSYYTCAYSAPNCAPR